MSSPSQWRVALRLARRETLRRPGRTVLVALLVAVPVAGMVVANVISRTNRGGWDREFSYAFGTADLGVYVDARALGAEDPTVDGERLERTLDERLDAMLPEGSRWETEIGLYDTSIRSDTRSVRVRFVDVDLDAPMRRDIIELRRGRAATSSDEVVLDRHSADAFGVDVGDRLVLEHPRGTFTVTGIARSSGYFGERLFVTRSFDWSRVADPPYVTVSIALPPGTPTDAASTVLRAEFGGAGISDRTMPPYVESSLPVATNELAWGWVFGAVALAVLGVIIAAAFATSARRQLVALGQLSANGADRSLLRLTLALQGSWSGGVGVATGMALAAAALLAGRPLLEMLDDRRLPPYVVAGSDLAMVATIGVVAATIAALVPARSASRVPVMAALGGRRPLGRVPRRLVLAGLLAFAIGLFLLVLAAAATTASQGASSDLWAAVALLGGLCILTAVVCTAPISVDLVGRVCARLPGAWRLGGRSLARTRARSAGVVAAIGAMTALVVAGTTMWATATVRDYEPGTWIPADIVSASTCSYPQEDASTEFLIDTPVFHCEPAPTTLAAAIAEIVEPEATLLLRGVEWDPAPFDATGPQPAELLIDGRIAIADPFLLDLVGLSSADRALLESTGVIRLQHEFSEFATSPRSVIETQDGRRLELDVATTTESFTSLVNTTGLLITPSRAGELGLPISEYETLFVLAAPLTGDQAERLGALGGGNTNVDVFDLTPAEQATRTARFDRIAYDAVPNDNRVAIQFAISIVATLLTLVVVAIGLSLSAIESRDERDVLSAIGAPPRVLRSVAARKALLMAAAGTLVAVPAGLVPVFVVLLASETSDRVISEIITIPWLTLGALVIGVPLVAAACTTVASAIAQRVRPTTMSTLRAD